MKIPFEPFVYICTSFFIGSNLASFSIIIGSEKINKFIWCFNNFYNRAGWDSFNKDLPLSYHFRFLNYPDFTPNILRSEGFKPDIRYIYFSKYISSILNK